jgi:putative membrane protein
LPWRGVAIVTASGWEAEERHIRKPLEAGAVSLETSRLARERSRDDWVKKFAEYETAEQETIREVLRSMGGRIGDDARSDRREARRDLREASGREFDSAYLEAQASGHEQLLSIQETYVTAAMTSTSEWPSSRAVISRNIST